MPLYDFICPDCGPFERWRDHRAAADPVACPGCGAPASRRFSIPGGRGPGSPFQDATGAERKRIDRAMTGEPRVVSGLPEGRRLAGHGHAHHHHPRGGRRVAPRPWQVGH